jgi:hypothetical protein
MVREWVRGLLDGWRSLRRLRGGQDDSPSAGLAGDDRALWGERRTSAARDERLEDEHPEAVRIARRLEDARRAERRDAYARFMGLVGEYERATAEVQAARRSRGPRRAVERSGSKSTGRESTGRESTGLEWTGLEWIGSTADVILGASERQARVWTELCQAREVVRLLGSTAIQPLADRWLEALNDDPPARAREARTAFVEYARAEVGADPEPTGAATPVGTPAPATPPMTRG